MYTNKQSVMITDPCYLLTREDWEKSDYGDQFYKFFPNSICDSTVYGDWSCTMYKITTESTKNVDHALTLCYSDNKIGEFCADAGMVCVVFMEDVCKYGSNIFEECGDWCYTIIPGFRNKDINYEREYDSNGDIHIVGRDIDGNIKFISKQTGD